MILVASTHWPDVVYVTLMCTKEGSEGRGNEVLFRGEKHRDDKATAEAPPVCQAALETRRREDDGGGGEGRGD